MYITFPPEYPGYKNRVYVIERGEKKYKVVGIEKAFKKTKWIKYNSFSSTVVLKNNKEEVLKIF